MNNLRLTIASTLSIVVICILTVAIAGRSSGSRTQTFDPANSTAPDTAKTDPNGAVDNGGSMIQCFHNSAWQDIWENDPPSREAGTDFGTAPTPGGFIRRTFRIINWDRDAWLEVESIRISSGDRTQYQLGWDGPGYRMSYEGAVTVNLVFRPTRIGQLDAEIEVDFTWHSPFQIGEPTPRRTWFSVTGEGTPAPFLQVRGNGQQIAHRDFTPSTEDGTDFGQVHHGAYVERTFTLRNTGFAPLDLQRVELDGADFTVVNPVGLGWTITPGQEFPLRVRLQPTQSGPRRCVVRISNNALSPYEFALAGIGRNSAPTIVSAPWATPNPAVFNEPLAVEVAASDPDHDPLLYTWSKVSGPGDVGFDPNRSPFAARSNATFSAPGTYILRVNVFDGQTSVEGDVQVFVNARPVITSAPWANPAVFPSRVEVGVTASDPDNSPQPLIYAWSQVSGPGSVAFALHETNPARRYATFSLPGAYILKVIVSDSLAHVEAQLPVRVNVNGDFNSDFKPDLLWQYESGTRVPVGSLSVWLMNGLQREGSTNIEATPPLDYAFVGCADFDGDAKSDLVFQHLTTRALAIWKMDGVTRVRNLDATLVVPINYTLRGCTDFDNDGHTDLLFQHDSRDELVVWKMYRAAYMAAVELPTPQPGYTLRSCADFNGDRHVDLLFQKNDDRKLFVWKMNGFGRVETIAISATPGPNYTLKGCADLSGDGKTDILFQHNGNRELVCWKMNGTSLDQSVIISTIPQAGWSLRWPR